MDKKNLTIKETFALAIQNHQRNNLQVAEKLYKEILKKNPSHVDAYNNLGAALQGLKKFEKAKTCYERVLNLDPFNNGTHLNYGELLLSLNQHAKGLEHIIKGSGCIKFTQKNFRII